MKWQDQMDLAGGHLVSAADRSLAVTGEAFLVVPTSPMRPHVACGTLDQIVRLGSVGLDCSQAIAPGERSELLAAADTCLKLQGAGALLTPLTHLGVHFYVAAGDLDQIVAMAASQITNLDR